MAGGMTLTGGSTLTGDPTVGEDSGLGAASGWGETSGLTEASVLTGDPAGAAGLELFLLLSFFEKLVALAIDATSVKEIIKATILGDRFIILSLLNVFAARRTCPQRAVFLLYHKIFTLLSIP